MNLNGEFSDWLATNQVDENFLLRNLTGQSFPQWAVAPEAYGACDAAGVSADEAWALASRSLAAALPRLSRLIRYIHSRAPKCLEPKDGKPERAFTYDHGRRQLPFVSCSYRGTASDVLTIAHEFSHAVQIVASRNSVMPPLAREVCAFIGEHALLDWVRNSASPLSPHLEAAWAADNQSYMGVDAERLRKALAIRSGAYDYRWNYPVARVLACAIWRHWERAEVVKFFRSGHQAPYLLIGGTQAHQVPASRFDLPPLPADGGDTINLYRQIGVATLLDLQESDQTAPPDMELSRRYETLLGYMQSRSLFIALDSGHVPIGYATWQRDGVTIATAHSCVPHTDRLPLFLKSLSRTCPDVGRAVERACQAGEIERAAS